MRIFIASTTGKAVSRCSRLFELAPINLLPSDQCGQTALRVATDVYAAQSDPLRRFSLDSLFGFIIYVLTGTFSVVGLLGATTK